VSVVRGAHCSILLVAVPHILSFFHWGPSPYARVSSPLSLKYFSHLILLLVLHSLLFRLLPLILVSSRLLLSLSLITVNFSEQPFPVFEIEGPLDEIIDVPLVLASARR